MSLGQSLTFPLLGNRVDLLRTPSIANTFIQPALTTRYHGALNPQSCQSDGYLFFITAADTIGDNVDFVTFAEEIEGGLGNANVGFYADYYTGEGVGERGEGGVDFGSTGQVSANDLEASWRRTRCDRSGMEVG